MREHTRDERDPLDSEDCCVQSLCGRCKAISTFYLERQRAEKENLGRKGVCRQQVTRLKLWLVALN